MARPVAAAVDSSPPFRPSSQRLVIPSSCCSAPPGADWASVHPLLGAYLASSSAPLTLSHGSVVPVGRNRGAGFCSLEPWTAGHRGYVWLLCLPDGKLTGLAASRPNTSLHLGLHYAFVLGCILSSSFHLLLVLLLAACCCISIVYCHIFPLFVYPSPSICSVCHVVPVYDLNHCLSKSNCNSNSSKSCVFTKFILSDQPISFFYFMVS